MTEITFFGGVGEIGGNQFLVKSKDATILMDFGKPFGREQVYFDEYLKSRGSSPLRDMFALGLLPKLEGAYRRDYAIHDGFGGNEDTAIDAVVLTHAHVDHAGYLNYLRHDIPVHCTEESKMIMQNFDTTGQSEQYLRLKTKFKVNKKGTRLDSRSKDNPPLERKVRIFKSGDTVDFGSIKISVHAVDHSLPGACGLILETPDGMIGNTGDVRFHGRRGDDTEKFVDACSKADLHTLLCEGTRVGEKPKKKESTTDTEGEIEGSAEKVIRDTGGLVICGYPMRDLDRFTSLYNACVSAGRYMVIDMKQAYLLKLFDESPTLKGSYPSPTDKMIRIYMHKAKWGVFDKIPDLYDEDQKMKDYDRSWMKDVLAMDNVIDYRDIKQDERSYLLSCSDFKLQELVDLEPSEGSSYIRSVTEPFNDEMTQDETKVKSWLKTFKLIHSDDAWNRFHVSGHGNEDQIKHVIDKTRAKRLVPIHTEHPEFHEKHHSGCERVGIGKTIKM